MRVLECGQDHAPDPRDWNHLVASDAQGHLLQTWEWGSLKGSFGWQPLRLAVEQDGALVAGAQVLYRRVGPATFAYIPKGPVLLDSDWNTSHALWEGIHAASRRRRALLLKVEPDWREDDPSHDDWLRHHGFSPSDASIQPRRTIVVDLTADEQEILARMKPKWRYNIRLASRKGVEIRDEGLEGLPQFYELMRITGERDGFGIHSEEYYRRALELFAPSDSVALFLAYLGNEPLAGLMAFTFNNQAWYMYGASSNSHREAMPNHALQFSAMQWAKRKGCRQYDLWGIPDEDTRSQTLEGVGRFKEGFGGQVVRFVGAYNYVYAPVLTRAAKAAGALLRPLTLRG